MPPGIEFGQDGSNLLYDTLRKHDRSLRTTLRPAIYLVSPWRMISARGLARSHSRPSRTRSARLILVIRFDWKLIQVNPTLSIAPVLDEVMELLLIIIVLFLLFGGGFYGYRRSRRV